MQIQTIDTEEKIAGIVSSIHSHPHSWKGWSALRIESGEYLSDQEFADAVISIKAILNSYLKDVEGSAFFYDTRYIYILCKAAPAKVLGQMGVQIAELVFQEIYLSAHYGIYDLGSDGRAFADQVLKDIGAEYLPGLSQDERRAPLHENGHHTKVLLVEDDAVIRWMVRNSLKNECDFASAPTAQNVFSIYPVFKPDIIFLDIGLPDNSGDEVLDWIMRQDPDACVVMLSGNDSLENISDCIGKGAKGFVAKPFIKENLLHYIRTYGAVA